MKVKKEDLSNGIYKNLGVSELELPLDSFYYRDKSKKSIGFKIDLSKSLADFFSNAFDLKNKDTFEKKLKQSISGDGKEFHKNNALHSSSLCALLMFYNVSEKTPFYIDIDGEEHKFTEVYFEVKNKVISRPSNMDVVLVNRETNEILFIECKFSEYKSHSNKYKLLEGYKPYKEEYFDAIGFDNMHVFPEGIKQLIAHYIGLNNFRNKEYDLDSFYPDEEDERRELYKTNGYSNVAFVEVIFDLNIDEFKTYTDETNKVFELLENKEKAVNAKPKIKMLYTKTYQELFKSKNKEILSDKVKEFYKLA